MRRVTGREWVLMGVIAALLLITILQQCGTIPITTPTTPTPTVVSTITPTIHAPTRTLTWTITPLSTLPTNTTTPTVIISSTATATVTSSLSPTPVNTELPSLTPIHLSTETPTVPPLPDSGASAEEIATMTTEP